ncbi:NUDIX domain-containing protein [Bacillus sp. PS06]|uniref:NUDIX domain-containing protein n=1 Tax=Bacillus sp. PS06 TaxID=2764176 RepID=UPI00177E376C|nr:NUDIX hydrolase [Bacillus sp. PS06]MBD8071088.1 NUDIX hydrolase [Bacillus sp. PS06]
MIRHAVGAIVIKGDTYLVIHKTKMNTKEGKRKIDGQWDFVKGGIEPHDVTLEAAIMRELSEETGSSDYRMIKQFDEKICFDFPEELKDRIGYERQETTMFLVEFVGDESSLTPQDDEIVELQFVKSNELIKTLTHEDTINFIRENLSKQSMK